jgi:MYXO-CTERM domain-containing protein
MGLAALIASASALAFDGDYLPIEGGQWDVESGPVPYSLEPSGSDDVGDGSDLDAVRNAFRAWECVPGTKLRFEESDTPGVKDVADDGINSLFWDETNDFALGPATLGVTIGDAGQGTRAQADIVFNGSDSSWSTDDGPSAVDVGSIALHEIGHFLGLDHPCEKSGDQETNCNGADRSVMTPVWDNQIERAPLPNDEEGVVALYPADDDQSRCDGPYRKGEACACDDECIAGLVCVVPADGGRSVCGATCASDNSDCGSGFACVLSKPAGDGRADGVCVKSADNAHPPGSVCLNGGQCTTGTCALLFDLSRSLCQEYCDADSDCTEGRSCYQGFCLGGTSHDACPLPPGGCSCASAAGAPWGGAAAGIAALLLLLRRRR